MSIKPIFIFSLPRSGSTLLQRILVSHPEIETISEPWFLIPSVYALRDSGVFAEYSAASLHKTMTHLISKLPNGKQDYYDGLRVFAETIYSRLNTKKAKYFLDKTPRYYLNIQEIEQILCGVNHPQTNGKEEKWFDFYERHRKRFNSLEELIDWYNKRPHGSLNLRRAESPNEAFIRKMPPECWFWITKDLFKW